jgi:hypothetical protein
MLRKMFSQTSPEESFWNWFSENSRQLMLVNSGREPILKALIKKLKAVHPGLVYEFGPTGEGQREFIISADGNRHLFPKVIGLVDQAPRIPGWVIIPFRQPKDLDMRIRLGDLQLSPDDIWYTSAIDGEKIGLRLFIKGYQGATRKAIQQASFIILDAVIGEYDMESKVGFIEWYPISDDPESQGLKSLRQLREELNSMDLDRPVI